MAETLEPRSGRCRKGMLGRPGRLPKSPNFGKLGDSGKWALVGGGGCSCRAGHTAESSKPLLVPPPSPQSQVTALPCLSRETMHGSEEGNRWNGMGLFSEMPGRGDVRGHRSAAGRAARRLHLLLLLSSIFRREGWNLLPSCLGTVPLPSLLPSAWLDKTLEPFPTRPSIAPGPSSPGVSCGGASSFPSRGRPVSGTALARVLCSFA